MANQKGHIRKKGQAVDKVYDENMRRVVLSALASMVFFIAVWADYIVVGTVPELFGIDWLWPVVYVFLEAIMAVIAFFAMAKNKRSYFQFIAGFYWVIEFLLFTYISLFTNSNLVLIIELTALMVAVALVPLLDKIGRLIAGILEIIIMVIHVAMGHMDLEHTIYTLVIFSLCMVLGSMSSSNFMRKVEDATKIHSATNQAETDPMTLLLNRRGLERRIGFVWPMCLRQRLEVAVVMLDIDNFKKYNDSFGHAAGDDCIKAVTKVLRDHTKRKTDYAARVGGEEFLVFLTGIDESQAIKWAESFKADVEKLKLKQSDDNFLPFVTVSMGLCHSLPKPGIEFWELRNEADRQLYQAKENGRACIYMADKCYAKTQPDSNRRQYLKEKMFHSI